jgi:hypothetical protein
MLQKNASSELFEFVQQAEMTVAMQALNEIKICHGWRP